MSLPSHQLQRHRDSKLTKSAKIYNKKYSMLSAYLIVFGSAAILISGCQTSPQASKTNTNAMIDFNTVDSTQSNAQGKAFNAQLIADDERYQQLFDQTNHPNTESQAKLHLLNAIRQHLATEQVAVAQARYNSAPFVDADSVDAGSSSLLRTMIELYAYKQSNEHDEAVEVAQADVDDAVAAIAAIAAINSDEAVSYDEDGFNEYGYDIDGYDQEGFDYYGYDANGFDKEGYDEYGYDQYGYSADEDESAANDGSMSSKLDKLNPKGLLRDYEAMQTQKQQTSTKDSTTANDPFTGMIGMVLGMFQRTPEQVQAMNAYQYKNLTFNSVSRYQPKQRQLQSVYSYDYITPTLSSSVQIPLALDFDNSRITIDPSALMPLVALVNPEHTPLPNQMTAHTVDFGLPETITSKLPSAVIYDAVIAAMQDSMAELAAENFSAVDIRGDAFAKEVGANRAVKVYFGSQQSGEMIGKMLKYISQSLERYVDANPDKYPDDAALKKAIDKIQLYNKGYQSADVGALMQLLEAVGPISFNQVNYYYLDNADRLLAKQQTIKVGGDLLGERTAIVNQIRYDNASFSKHLLTPLLTQSFGTNAKPAMDGNAWLTIQRQRKDQLTQARYARYSYDGDESVYETNEDNTEAVDAVDGDTILDSQKF